MYSEPCAKLTTRVTPKISVSPAATRNSDDAAARPFSSCSAKETSVTGEAAGDAARERSTPLAGGPHRHRLRNQEPLIARARSRRGLAGYPGRSVALRERAQRRRGHAPASRSHPGLTRSAFAQGPCSRSAGVRASRGEAMGQSPWQAARKRLFQRRLSSGRSVARRHVKPRSGGRSYKASRRHARPSGSGCHAAPASPRSSASWRRSTVVARLIHAAHSPCSAGRVGAMQRLPGAGRRRRAFVVGREVILAVARSASRPSRPCRP